MEKGERRCKVCGFELPAPRPKEIVKPGVLKKYGGSINTKYGNGDLWKALSTCAKMRHPMDNIKAEKFAKMQYKNLTGNWPPYGEPLDNTGFYNEEVELAVNANVEAFIRRQKRESRKLKNERNKLQSI